MTNDTRGSIVRQGSFLRIDHAFVEEVSFSGRNTGYILVSYSASRQSGGTSIELLRLNVNNSTIVLNSFRLPMCFCELRRGMWIDTILSPVMTRSIPPQSNAFIIMASGRTNPASPNTTTGRIARVDVQNNLLYTGNINNIGRQTRFVITPTTVIQDRNGFPIGLRSLRPGQLVRITHANFQTAGIPPQTTAFHIQLV